MYEQLVRVHNRLTKDMGVQENHVAALNEEISRCYDDLMAAHELLKQITMEFGTTQRIAQSAAAAVQFGVEPGDAVAQVDKLMRRLGAMEQAVEKERAAFGERVVRSVPIEWVGCANEVVLMGDFDGWTRGQELSAEDITSDSVYARFEGTLRLRPGRYRVKLQVDGEWRLANGWPMEQDGSGNDVNVLVVD
ncbi:MAG: hypothetical protein J3K34DRAFT_430856 [Monoraphidium minutum]|nr:MAG: hypothetical protein J3K34DRAFT_430856 [Monoraphidium minutum]